MGSGEGTLHSLFMILEAYMKNITAKFIGKYFEEIISSVLFLVTLTLVIINVITRYVFRTGIPWAEEFATGCFLWTAFIGSAACYKRRQHVGVDILVNKFPIKAQNTIKMIVDCILAFLCSYMFYISCIYIARSYRKPTAILGISSVTFSISLTLSFIDMAIWSFIFIFKDWKSIKENGRVIGEEE